jgi:hypothetical protein
VNPARLEAELRTNLAPAGRSGAGRGCRSGRLEERFVAPARGEQKPGPDEELPPIDRHLEHTPA